MSLKEIENQDLDWDLIHEKIKLGIEICLCVFLYVFCVSTVWCFCFILKLCFCSTFLLSNSSLQECHQQTRCPKSKQEKEQEEHFVTKRQWTLKPERSFSVSAIRLHTTFKNLHYKQCLSIIIALIRLETDSHLVCIYLIIIKKAQINRR